MRRTREGGGVLRGRAWIGLRRDSGGIGGETGEEWTGKGRRSGREGKCGEKSE
jgi:hypothetical protein